MTRCTVVQADWSTQADAIRAIRTAVFIDEQGVDPALEWDDEDATSIHVLARVAGADDAIVGTARLQTNGKIGRMAVLQPWRRRGIGAAMLDTLTRLARDQGMGTTWLHAQTQALGFYQRHGYNISGKPFSEANIPHVRMERVILPR